jgi:hypothetical protein
MELAIIPQEIHEFRRFKGMIDRDLAQWYEVTTANLNKEECNLIFQLSDTNIINIYSKN